MNLDNTNLRKQTSVHLLWGQTALIVDEKGSIKIDFNNIINSPEEDFLEFFVEMKFSVLLS